MADTIEPVEAERLPRGLVDLYNRYSFTPLDPHGAYAYQTLDEWRTVTEHAMATTWAAIAPLRTTDPALYEAEIEWVEKLKVCWRAHGLGAATKWEPQTTYNAEQRSLIERDLSDIGDELAARLDGLSSSELRALHDEGTIPVAHGKGAPHWFNSNDRHAAMCLASIAERAHGYDDLEARLTQLAESRIGLVLTSYTRIQSSRKASEAYVIAGDELVQRGERIGPKVRTIQALPWALNYVSSGVGNCLKWAMQQDPTMSGNISDALRIASEHATDVVIATDLSTFDDTVSAESDESWARNVLERSLNVLARKGLISHTRRNLIMEIEDHVRYMPLLCPPRNMRLGAEQVPTAGRIKSGKRMTSIEGTTINRARARAKLRKHGVQGIVINWGDDTIVIITGGSQRSIKAFKEDVDFAGFKETVAPDNSFLMKRLPYGYGYLGRMIMGTINREVRFEPNNIQTAALGIATRRGILKGHPLAHHFDAWLATTPSRAIRLAGALAIGADYHSLMRSVAAMAEQRGANWDAMVDTIDRAFRAGLISADMVTELMRIAEKAAYANEPPYGIVRDNALAIPTHVAVKYLNKQAYTTQERIRQQHRAA